MKSSSVTMLYCNKLDSIFLFNDTLNCGRAIKILAWRNTTYEAEYSIF